MIVLLPDDLSHRANDSLIDITHATPTIDPNLTHSGLVSTTPVNNFPKSNSQATHHVKLLLWNVRSLNKQITKFQSYIYAADYDVLAITETWLSGSIYSNEILPNNYNIICRDCDTRGGGVLLAIKNSIPFKQLPVPDDIEILSVEITLQKQAHIICLIYRLPSTDET